MRKPAPAMPAAVARVRREIGMLVDAEPVALLNDVVAAVTRKLGVSETLVRVAASNEPFVVADFEVQRYNTSERRAPDFWSLPQSELTAIIPVRGGYMVDVVLDAPVPGHGQLTVPHAMASLLNLAEDQDAAFPLVNVDGEEDVQFRWEAGVTTIALPASLVATARPGDALRIHVHGRPKWTTRVSLHLLPACVAAEARLLHQRVTVGSDETAAQVEVALAAHVELLAMRVAVEEPLDQAAAQSEMARMIVQQVLESSRSAAQQTSRPQNKLGRIIVRKASSSDAVDVPAADGGSAGAAPANSAGDGQSCASGAREFSTRSAAAEHTTGKPRRVVSDQLQRVHVEWMWTEEGLFMLVCDRGTSAGAGIDPSSWLDNHGFAESTNQGSIVHVRLFAFDGLDLADVASVIASMLRQGFGVDVTDSWRFSPSRLAERAFTAMPDDTPQWCGGDDVRNVVRAGISLTSVFTAPAWLQPWLASAPLDCRPVKKPLPLMPRRIQTS